MGIDGLREVLVHACVQTLVPFTGHRVGRHCHNRTTVGMGVSKFSGGREAVHDGHLNVHQHEVVASLGGFGHSFFPVPCYVCGDAYVGQKFLGQFEVHFVVLHEQHVRARQRLTVGVHVARLAFSRRAFVRPFGQALLDFVEQRRRRHRLDQVTVNELRLRSILQGVLAKRRHHQHSVVVGVFGLDALNQLKAVHIWHVPIGHNQIHMAAASLAFLKQAQSLFRRRGVKNLKTKRLKHVFQHGSRGQRIVDEQDTKVLQRAVVGRWNQGVGRLNGTENVKRERRALTRCGHHLERTAQQLNQTPGDDQTEARAPVFPRGGVVRLPERLKDLVELVSRNANAAVRHFKCQDQTFSRLGLQPAGQLDFPALGELHGIVHEVHGHLTQPCGIGHHNLGQVLVQVHHKLDVRLGFELDVGDVRHLDHQVFQTERNVLDDNFTRFHFGKIQDVVDDVEQGFSAALDLLDVLHHLRFRRPLQGEVRHPNDGVHRGPDFVAHVGQEQTLGRVGLVGFAAKLLHFMVALVEQHTTRLHAVHLAATEGCKQTQKQGRRVDDPQQFRLPLHVENVGPCEGHGVDPTLQQGTDDRKAHPKQGTVQGKELLVFPKLHGNGILQLYAKVRIPF